MEKRVQGWSRKKRQALIEGRYGDLKELSPEAATKLRRRGFDTALRAYSTHGKATRFRYGAARLLNPREGDAVSIRRCAPTQPTARRRGFDTALRAYSTSGGVRGTARYSRVIGFTMSA
jgi:hypothetical protein